METRIMVPQEGMSVSCRRCRIVELALFGSVIRDGFGPENDVDILVRFRPETQHSLLDMESMWQELSRMLGREADLVERVVVERSRSYSCRRSMLQSAEVVYVA